MTEQEWLTSDQPRRLVEYLCDPMLSGKYVSPRKCQLLGLACCDRIRSLFGDERSINAVKVVERNVEGQASDDEMGEAREAALDAAEALCTRLGYPDYKCSAEHYASYASYWSATRDHTQVLRGVFWWANRATARHAIGSPRLLDENQLAVLRQIELEEDRKVAFLLRDIFGNPFRSFTLDPAWLAWNGGTVVHLAQVIYEERAFDRLPILADALEDAGCTEQAILEHCRGDTAHVRGCWVVDLLTGRN